MDKSPEYMELLEKFKKHNKIHIQITNALGDGMMVDDFYRSAIFVVNEDGKRIMSAIVGEFNDDEMAAMFAAELELMDEAFDAKPSLRDMVGKKLAGTDMKFMKSEGNLDSLRDS